MIKRGTPNSRRLAILTAASPALLLIGLFAFWAYGRWSSGGEALHAAAMRRHEATAQTTQARQYAPLGEAWRDYARGAAAGLDRSADAETALADLETRLRGLFAEAGGSLRATLRLADGSDVPEGLQQLRVEASGAAPEAALRRMLRILETETPYVFVELLDLKRSEGGALSVRLRLSLYRLTEGGA